MLSTNAPSPYLCPRISTPRVKPGKLTAEEFMVMKKHVDFGIKIIDRIIARSGGDEFLLNARMFTAYHHERWDGSGYPHGFKGEEIPIHGRIMGIVDVYDALISERPYKKAFTDEQAMEIITAESGRHFDPKIVDIFVELHDRFIQTREDSEQ